MKKQLNVRIPADVYRQVKIEAASHGISVESLVTESLSHMLAKDVKLRRMHLSSIPSKKTGRPL